MINKKIFAFLALLLAFTLLFTTGAKTQTLFPSEGGIPPKPGSHAPVITHAYAIDKGAYGAVSRSLTRTTQSEAPSSHT